MRYKNILKFNWINLVILFLFVFLLFIKSVSATLEVYGANDYQGGFDPNNAYLQLDSDIVNLGSGTFTITNTDIYLAGKNGLDLKLERNYNSGVWVNRIDGDNINDEQGQLQEFSYLGVGWEPFSFGVLRLTWTDGPQGNYFYPEGSYIEFGDGNQFRLYKNLTGTGYEVKNHKNWKFFYDNGDYKLIKEDGTTYLFNENTCLVGITEISFMGSTINTATSKYCYVTSITDTHGNSINIYYKPVPSGGNENIILPQNHGAIDYIVDSLGREIHFYYNIIQDDLYITGVGENFYLEHYILDKITYNNANNELITVDYSVTQIDDTITFPLANTPYWAWHTYRLDKVEVKKGNVLLKPATYYYYNDYGELEKVIYKKKSDMPDSHLTEDAKIVYEYDKVKHQYSSLWSENLAGYSSRLKLRKVYDGMGNMYEWQYKYGNGLNNYYDSNNGGLTQRTFLHCDDNALATVINCATSSRVGPVETGGTVLNNYKQVKIIDPNGNYIVNYYYGTDADINNLGGVWNGGWEKVRDTVGLLKSSSAYTLTNVLLNKKEYNYNFIFQQVSNQNYPYGQDYYRKRLSELKETKYNTLDNYETYTDKYSFYDEYDNLKYYERKGDSSISSFGVYSHRYDSDDRISKINSIVYLHENNINYKNANILNKIKENRIYFYFLASGTLMGGTIDVLKNIYEYDTFLKGDLISEQQVGLNGNDPSPITEYEYDNYGNVITKIDANNNNFETRYNNGFNAYPSSGWNDEYGSQSDPAWRKTYYNNGLLKEDIDKNGGIVKYYYDDLDRIKKIVYPGDTESQPSIEYIYYDFKNSMKIKNKRENNVYNNYVYYFYDGLGRLIQTRQRNSNVYSVKYVDTDTIIVSSIKYDGVNKEVYVSKLYEESSSVSNYNIPNWANLLNNNKVTQYEYDALNRVIKEINFDNTDIQVKYGPNWKIITDENNIKTLYRYDAFDDLISVEENYEECNNGETKECPLRLGVCNNNYYQTCSNGVWPEICYYGPNYDIGEFGGNRCIDNLDNDCDDLVDSNDPDCQTGSFCFKQTGVCENAVPSIQSNYVYCTPNDYGLKYQRVEIDCNDNLDNDCDGLIDEEDNCNNILTQYHYDILNNLIRVVDAEGKVTQKTYNSLNWLIYNKNFDIGLEEYRYDNKGNMISKITNNVLKNSNFENGNEYWTFDTGVSLSTDSYFGSKGIRASGQYKYANQEAYILDSQDYILSLYAKADSKNLGVIIYLYDVNGNEIDPDLVSIGNGWNPGCSSTSDHHCWYSGSIPVENEYSRIFLPYFFTPANAYKIKIGIGAAYDGGGYIYIDGVQLEKGNEAKVYSLIEYSYNGINDIIETNYPSIGD